MGYYLWYQTRAGLTSWGTICGTRQGMDSLHGVLSVVPDKGWTHFMGYYLWYQTRGGTFLFIVGVGFLCNVHKI